MKKIASGFVVLAIFFAGSHLWSQISNAAAIKFRDQILIEASKLEEGSQTEVRAKNTKKICIQSGYVDERSFNLSTQDDEIKFVRIGTNQQFAIHLVSDKGHHSHAAFEGNLIRLDTTSLNPNSCEQKNSVILRHEGRFVIFMFN